MSEVTSARKRSRDVAFSDEDSDAFDPDDGVEQDDGEAHHEAPSTAEVTGKRKRSFFSPVRSETCARVCARVFGCLGALLRVAQGVVAGAGGFLLFWTRVDSRAFFHCWRVASVVLLTACAVLACSAALHLQEVIAVLRGWLQRHADDPYPTRAVMQELGRQTQLTFVQVRQWFINYRRYVFVYLHARRACADCFFPPTILLWHSLRS